MLCGGEGDCFVRVFHSCTCVILFFLFLFSFSSSPELLLFGLLCIFERNGIGGDQVGVGGMV